MSKKKARRNKQTIIPAGLILVDAYNVIRSDESLDSAFNTQMELARNRLRDMCRSFRNFKKKALKSEKKDFRICLVFDGDSSVGMVPDKSREQILSEKDGVREVFTSSDTKADDYILGCVKRREAGQGSWVISNDLEVIQECRLAGAYVLSPEEFVKQSRPKSPGSGKRTGQKKGTGPRRASSRNEKFMNQKQKEDLISEFEEMFGNDLDRSV